MTASTKSNSAVEPSAETTPVTKAVTPPASNAVGIRLLFVGDSYEILDGEVTLTSDFQTFPKALNDRVIAEIARLHINVMTDPPSE